MKTKLLLACLILLCTATIEIAIKLRPAKEVVEMPSFKIIEKAVDERGYTSVVFCIGKDTGAYDYLTPAEYGRLIETGSPDEVKEVKP